MKKRITLVIIFCSFIISSCSVVEAKVGNIVAVNAKQDTILLKTKQQIKEYQLALQAEVKLNKRTASLQALRPVQDKGFKQAQLKLNQAGQVKKIVAAYQAVPISLEEVTENKVIVNNLTTDQQQKYQLTAQVKIIKNNYQVNSSQLKAGAQGVVILGLNNQLQRIIVHHYQLSGRIKEINYQTRELTINLGTRLEPKLKTFLLPQKVTVTTSQGRIDFTQLKINNWVKLELDQQVNRLLVREL